MIATEYACSENDRQQRSQIVSIHEGSNVGPQRLSRAMEYRKLKWVGLLLAIALAAGGYLGYGAYAEHQKLLRSEETFSLVLDHLGMDQQISVVLKEMEAGYVKQAAESLRVLLCRDIVSLNSRLASANDRARSAAQSTFSKMAQFQPKPPPETTGTSVRERLPEEIEAQKILALALAEDLRTPAQAPRLSSGAK